MTHRGPHMVHKVFDTDYLSRSFKQSGKMLLSNLSGLLKGYCSAFKTTLKTDFVCKDEIAARRHIIKSHKRLVKLRKQGVLYTLGFSQLLSPWKYLGLTLFRVSPKLGQYFLRTLFSPVLASIK